MLTHFMRFIYLWTGVCLTAVFADDLLMVQVLWRHGDRSPTKTFANDPNQESAWPLGWGQLTPQGMEQHMILGDLLYDEYVNKQQFLNTSLSFNQMFVRSTDVNRTYISAYSNLFGMYYNRTESIPGVNFPENSRWPGVMVPFPVHSVTDYDHDHVGNPLSYCPRRDWLWNKAKEAPELVKLQQDIESLLIHLNEVTGSEIDIDNLWYVRDAIFIEKLHQKPVIINDTLFDEINAIVDLLENYEDGLDLTPTDGIDFSIEIPKVRGGGILWSVINNFDLKLHCLDPINESQSRCKWMKNMKYYAYSVHDTTISALMATLGAKKSLFLMDIRPIPPASLWNSGIHHQAQQYEHYTILTIQLDLMW
uniref:acid phosphatase n=1 Tax=Ascaris suum TaxID=6253 RepID=F1L5M3_ASCSU